VAPPTEPTETIESVKAESLRLKDQLLRTAADFDNFRKRTRRDLADAERRGREDQLRELLPVFDNLERATAHSSTASDVKALADGIGMVLKQFIDTLGRLGVERITAVGQPFDPEFHEAIQQLETAQFAPGIVAAEVLAGYRLGDKLVRPSMVVVAKAPPVADAAASGSDATPATEETPSTGDPSVN
jgi:molecular chaperone GrpE